VRTQQPTHGFSLIELSIVLVILGLLTGGILAGQSLIRAAQLRAVSTEFTRYQTGMQTFRDKYFALPGDVTNATAFWGTANASANNCRIFPSTGTETCNGDGNGKLDYSTASIEMLRAWQHLASAGLIEGKYAGASINTVYTTTNTTTAPSSRMASGLWFVGYMSAGTFTDWSAGVSGTMFAGNYGNSFLFGSTAANGTPGNMPTASLLKPAELWNIDTKLDDGKPVSGKVWAGNYATCTNASGPTDKAATYQLDSDATGCMAIFLNAI
jgi:prepilin-type N-terminal cleavage/methylation domain-containing protein